MIRRPPRSTLFPLHDALPISQRAGVQSIDAAELARFESEATERTLYRFDVRTREEYQAGHLPGWRWAPGDRKSTRLNSSHSQISYAVFCLKKKKKRTIRTQKQ